MKVGKSKEQSMKRQRSMYAMLTVCAAVLVLGAATARAQVLQQVPSDAVVVIKIGNLKAVSDKVAKFATELGLAAVSPEFADPLASMQTKLNIKEGLDPAGEMAIVFTKMSFDGTRGGDPGMLVYIPVTDYKAFLANFKDVKTEGAVSTFTPQEGQTEMHGANWGKYAVLTRTPGMLDKKPTGLKLSGLAAKEAKEKDAFMFANIPVLAEFAMPQLAKARSEMNKELDKALDGNDQGKQFAGVAKAAAGQALTIAERFMQDATGATMSFHLSDAGIATTMSAEFKSGSYGANLAKQFKSSAQPMMAGLPDRKYFMAGGMVNAPEAMGKVLSDLLDPINKELAATESGKSFTGMIDALKRSMAATKSFSFGYVMPTGGIGTESVMQSIAVMQGDSKTIAESQKVMITGMTDLMKMMPKQEGAPEMNFVVTPGAKTIGDVKLDTYTMDMKMDPNNPAGANMENMMTLFYGPNGMGGTYGVVNKSAFLVVQGGSDELLTEAVSAAKNPKDVLSGTESVKRVNAKLPSQRVMVEYIFVDNIATTALKYAQNFGVQLNVQLPPDLSPIGISAGTDGAAFRMDAFIPTDLVQAVVGAGMQAAMQFQGGGGPGAAPGGNPDGL
jgi:hypothetical protein